MTTKCINCRAKQDVTKNRRNFREKYYCENCDQPFNPNQWPCPQCGTDEDVSLNPFDDNKEYYCYTCELVFNRLGPSFDPDNIEYESLKHGFDASTKQLTLDVEKTTTTSPQIYVFTLENTGHEGVEIQGRQAIAVQYRVTDDDWWTIHGNPEKFTPDEQFTLTPNESLQWDLELSRTCLGVPRVRRRERFRNGEYRLIYWGVPSSDTVLATAIEVEHLE